MLKKEKDLIDDNWLVLDCESNDGFCTWLTFAQTDEDGDVVIKHAWFHDYGDHPGSRWNPIGSGVKLTWEAYHKLGELFDDEEDS